MKTLNRERILYLCLLAFILILFYFLRITDPVYQLKHDDSKNLVCTFKDGDRVVPKNKIIMIDDNGCFAFDNGYACNCRIIGGNDDK